MTQVLGLVAVVLGVSLRAAHAGHLTVRAKGTDLATDEKPQGKKATVQLEIFYETLCPYCHALLDGSFRQIMADQDFRNRLDIHLVPFGNAMVIPEDKISAGYHFFHPDAKYPVIICQHHFPECLGNEIQTCVNHMEGTNKTVDLVLCMAGKSVKGQGIEMASYDCMKDLGIEPKKVKACVGSDDNMKRMIAHGQRSTRPELNRSYVPWVMADNQHVEMDDDHDLITPLCNMLAPPLPALCNQPVKHGKDSKSTALAATGRSMKLMEPGSNQREVDVFSSAGFLPPEGPAPKPRPCAKDGAPSLA